MSRRVPFRLVGGDPGVRADDPEPSLYALLDDSVMKLLMQRDNIHRTELLFAIEVARLRLRSRAMPAPGRPETRLTFAADCYA